MLARKSCNASFFCSDHAHLQSSSASALLSQPNQLLQLRQAMQLTNQGIQSAPQLVLSAAPAAVPQAPAQPVQPAPHQLAANVPSLLSASPPGALGNISSIAAQLGRHSLDDTAVLPSTHMAARRRTSRASIGLNLDGLDLSTFRFLDSDTGEVGGQGLQLALSRRHFCKKNIGLCLFDWSQN
jgi:hypothetical protein